MVKKAGFKSHFKGYVYVVPPPEQANLAAKEAGPQRSVQFRDMPEEICLVPESLQAARSLAASETQASSCMRKSPSDKFLSHPELPECILTRTQTREFAADFVARNVTSEWLKLSEHDRRRSVIFGFHWPTLLNSFIASCLFHRIPVTAPIRNAWDRFVLRGSCCPTTNKRTWYGAPPTAEECQLPSAGVVDLSNLHSAAEAAAMSGVFFVQDPAYNTVFDSGCSPVALANSRMEGLRNIRLLQPAERFTVRGIGGEIQIEQKGELHYRVPSELYNIDAALRAELAKLQVCLSREDPLFYYFVIPCFIDDALPTGMTLISLGQAVLNLDWCVQLAKDPQQCFGLSPVDEATGMRFKFSFSIGDHKTGSFGSASPLLRMPGLEHVPAGLDALTAARDAAAKLRALAFAAMENRVSSNCDEQLNGEFAAYSLISGYGF
jgi:hypothetical protein